MTPAQEQTEINRLRAQLRRLEEDNKILGRPRFSSPGTSTPTPLIMAFMAEQAAEGPGPCARSGVAVRRGQRADPHLRIGVDVHEIHDPAEAHAVPVSYRRGDVVSPYIPF